MCLNLRSLIFCIKHIFSLGLVILWAVSILPTSAMAQGNDPFALGEKVDEILAEDIEFDWETGVIRYTLPVPALVRLRTGIGNGGPMLRNLLDWERQEAGPQEVKWDFRDASGKIFFGPSQDYMLTISCLPADIPERTNRNRIFAGYRNAPKFSLEFPDSKMVDDVPQVKHLDPMRVTIAEVDRQWLTETKYEVVIFIDNVLLMEEEEGINPFTYRLDTRGLREGKHKVTLNIVGYEGEIGTGSYWMNIVK